MADREKMVQGLVAMAAADGRIGKREKKVVEILADRWGVGRDVVEGAIDDARAGKGRLSIPAEPEARRELLKALVSVAAVDGVIEPGERAMLEAFADRAGTSRDDLERMLEKTLNKKKRKGESGSGSGSAAAAPPPRAPSSPAPAVPQPAQPVGQQAVPITLGTTEVYGDPPFKDGARAARLCGFCAEAVPRDLKSCPFCDTAFGGKSTDALSSDPRFKIGALVGALLLFLAIPYMLGVQKGREYRNEAQVTLDMNGKPTPAELRAAVKGHASKANKAAVKLRKLERAKAIARKKLDRYQNLPNALRYAREHPKNQREALEDRQREFQSTAGGK